MASYILYQIAIRPLEKGSSMYIISDNTFNDQVLIVSMKLLLSVVQLVHQLVDLLTHLTIPY